jgi:hypothetical protein
MLAQRPVKLLLLFVLIVGFFPVIGWAGGPKLLTDEDMDGIYAKGIWLNFDIDIALPGGNSFSVPSFTMPGNVGGISGGNISGNATNPSVNTSTANAGQTSTSQTTPSTTSETNTSSPGNYAFNYPGAGIQISDSAMQGNSGMIINAPNSAVSMSISVVVLNNSTVAGDILQSSNSYPTNLFMSFKSYMK